MFQWFISASPSSLYKFYFDALQKYLEMNKKHCEVYGSEFFESHEFTSSAAESFQLLILSSASISYAVISIRDSHGWYRDTATFRPYIGARMSK